MIRSAPLLLLLAPLPVAAQSVTPGGWDVTSTATDLVVPGTPDFILRMAKGHSKTVHKCLTPEQAHAGAAALFAPDPKNKCTVQQSTVANGHVDQVMMCPQKTGDPARAVRTGTYDATKFTARLTMSRQSPKGPVRIVLDQAGTSTGSKCH